MKKSVRIGLTVFMTGLAVGYLVWKVDIHQTVDTLLDADPWWFALAVAIMIGTALPMALRWQWLMRAQRMEERFWWLTRAYFVSYAASQVLPTSVGGDAMRVYETSRRHPGRTADVTAIILLERGLGGAGTVLLGAIGFLLALGTYDVSAYLWLEGAFVLGTIVLMFLFFARSARPLLARTRRSCGASCRPPAPRVLRGRPPLPRARPPAGRCVRLHDGDPGGARPLDLGGGEGRRDRARSADLLRDGPALLPRPAGAVHAQRHRRARGVLRQLPGQRRRSGRPGLRVRLPLLPRHHRPRAPGGRDPALGGDPRRLRPRLEHG